MRLNGIGKEGRRCDGLEDEGVKKGELRLDGGSEEGGWEWTREGRESNEGGLLKKKKE